MGSVTWPKWFKYQQPIHKNTSVSASWWSSRKRQQKSLDVTCSHQRTKLQKQEHLSPEDLCFGDHERLYNCIELHLIVFFIFTLDQRQTDQRCLFIGDQHIPPSLTITPTQSGQHWPSDCVSLSFFYQLFLLFFYLFPVNLISPVDPSHYGITEQSHTEIS